MRHNQRSHTWEGSSELTWETPLKITTLQLTIRAEANLYLPEYARYFWRRRHDKEARLLAALSARAHRAMRA